MSCMDEIEYHFQTWMVGPFMSFPNLSQCKLQSSSHPENNVTADPKGGRLIDRGNGTANLQNLEIYDAMHQLYKYILKIIEAWNTLQEVLVSQQQKHVRPHKSTDFNFHHIFKEKLTFNGMLPHQICLQQSSQIFPRLFQLHFSVFSLSSPAIVAFGWRLLRTFGWEGNQNDGFKFWSDATGCRLNEDETHCQKMV